MSGFFSLFLNPWFMVAGGALISAPIIIHLINRMRFRRLRWAAMEFLLKSQKRNRRRLIIEQLILLALRCLLVVLAGLLVARFITAATDAALTEHYVVIDDTLSLTDYWREGGNDTAFDVSKKSVKEIARKHLAASSAQQLRVVSLSDLQRPIFDKRLNSETLDELNRLLDDKELQPTALHIKPAVALDEAIRVFNDEKPQGKRVFHLVSDFRQRDWSGPEADPIAQKIATLTGSGVDVRLVDTAHPARAESRQVTSEHDNLAVLELRPESRVIVQDVPARFTVAIHNFSAREQENVRLVVKTRAWLPKKEDKPADAAEEEPEEGRPSEETERRDSSETIQRLPTGRSEYNFPLGLNQLGFNQVSVTLEHADAGLPGDNVRYTVVEVRPQVPLLIIDGDHPKPGLGDTPPKGSGTLFLRGVFEAARGYRLESGTVEDLANGFHSETIDGREVKRNLDEYPCILLVNVPHLRFEKPERTEKARANLEKFVREGGGVAFFCGDKVEPSYYNLELHRRKDKDGKEVPGLFPVPLPDQATKPLDPEEINRRLIDFQPKLYPRNQKHQFFDAIEKDTWRYLDLYHRFLALKQYWPVPRQKWVKTRTMEEIITLPNTSELASYRQRAQELLGELMVQAGDERFAVYVPGLERHEQILRNGLVPGVFKQLYELEQAINDLLTDRGDPQKKDTKRPNLEEFWALPGNQSLRARLEDFRDTIQYGDPLVVADRYGKGRVVAWLTGAGDRWNNWPNGEGIGKSYSVMMLTLQKFLGSPEDIAGLKVGEPLYLQLDGSRYEPRVRAFLIPEVKPNEQAPPKGGLRLEDRGEITGTTDKNDVRFLFTETKKPGTYCFLLYPKAAPGAKVEPERRAYAFNVDAEAEGDLKRAPREALEWTSSDAATPGRGNTMLFNLDQLSGQKLKRQSDWSQGPWLYLIILAVLIAEQAMAVHLSFHLKGNEAQLPPQVMRSQQPAAA